MHTQTEDFLDGLVEQMMQDFSPAGVLAARKSGEVYFRQTPVYYKRQGKELLILIVDNVRYELPIF